MAGSDPLETQQDVTREITAELRAVGFDDASEIGRGGFGVVFRCLQTSLDRQVAVKVLTSDLDEDNTARFIREQRAMGRLTGHPNIVGVLHAGTTATGRPYIVMQYHAKGSLDARIRRQGPLALDEVFRLGIKVSGALETAHNIGIVHRDVKPANILFTDYGEPAITDFGIAHISGGFETATGTITGSPAFTAPEVLQGQETSVASDMYGLGATLFCALTGHAAFERHSGERLVAQFVRITTQSVPDLRETGLPDDLCTIVERTMSRNPEDRPNSAAALGAELRRLELLHGLPVDEMALHVHDGGARASSDPPRSEEFVPSGPHRPAARAPRGPKGNLPIELTSFVGRRTELTEAKSRLSTSRLVTLTGIGGVGKTRLACRVANSVRKAFRDGVWLVELGDLRDEALLADVVATGLGLRTQSVRPTPDLLVEFLAASRLLLVLDNCEHVVDAAAKLAETLLQTCPELRILTTSREPLNIGGEAVLRVPPLAVPDPDRQLPIEGMPRYDAVTLFAQRAAEAVPTFDITEANQVAVARICHRLEGLPLPIELAAARLRAMSAEQVLQRLTDRYRLLTHGSRVAPTRQQTLQFCIDWSYELCTPKEQQVWGLLSVFAGTFEIDAAECICDPDLVPDLSDIVESLVDKSILIREEPGTVVRFRLLETLREYGRDKIQQAGQYSKLRRQHRDWYQALALEAEAEWISPRQLELIARLERELPNFREAMGFSLTEPDDSDVGVGLEIATALFPFWHSRGLYREGRRWLDRLLARPTDQPTRVLVRALYADSVLAGRQGDASAGIALMEQGRLIADERGSSFERALIAYADGYMALYSDNPARAVDVLPRALEVFHHEGALMEQIATLHGLGLASELLGRTTQAVGYHEQAIRIAKQHGDSVYQGRSSLTLGLALWRQGDGTRAVPLLHDGLRLARKADDPVGSAWCLEILAWTAAENRNHHRAAVLMGAAAVLRQRVGNLVVHIPGLKAYHDECERVTRRSLGEREFGKARNQGENSDLHEIVRYALGETPKGGTSTTDSPRALSKRPPGGLTRRERQVADLVAEGMTNKAIANRLVISQRTAQGHVEHILVKLGFTSRAQIAAWVAEGAQEGMQE